MIRIPPACNSTDNLLSRPALRQARQQSSLPPTGDASQQQPVCAAFASAGNLSGLPPSVAKPEHSRIYTSPPRRPVRSIDMVAAQTRSAALPGAQLRDTHQEIARLLQRQPDFQRMTKQAYLAALQAAFPRAPGPLDPDLIYITEYEEEELELPDHGRIGIRIPIASHTLTEVLQTALANGSTPTYTVSRTGFFYSRDNANPAQTVPGMAAGASHLVAFEKILENSINQATRNYRKAFERFWHRPDTTLGQGKTPAAWLTEKYATQRLIEQKLRTTEGAPAVPVARWLMDGNDKPTPASFTLRLQDEAGDIPFSGIVVFTRSPDESPAATTGPVMLMIPGQPIMEFASSNIYKRTLQQIFDFKEQRDILLNFVAREDRQRAAGIDNSVRAASPFAYVAVAREHALPDSIQSLLNQQGRDITYAGRQRLAPDAAQTVQAMFDIQGTIQERLQQQVDQFLQNASAADRSKWTEELTQYQVALHNTQTSGLPDMRQYLAPDFLNRYARTKVQERIRQDLQLDIDPDQIKVTTYERTAQTQPYVHTCTEERTSTMTLTALALANTTPLDQSYQKKITVTNTLGQPLPALTHQYLTDTVRALDISRHYQELLQSHLLDSPEARARAQAYAAFMQARLQLDAREARIGNEISAPAMHWVHAALTATRARVNPQTVNVKTVQPRDLRINDIPLNDILIFAPPPAFHPHSGPAMSSAPYIPNQAAARVVVYTPAAPDGKRLREYANRAQMNQDFINAPAMRDYLWRQADPGRQGQLKILLTGGVAEAQVTDTLMPEDFLNACYRRQAGHILADAAVRSTSNADIERQARWNKFNTTLDIAGIFLPPVVAIPLSLGRATYAFYNAHQERQRGNNDMALEEIFSGLNHLGNAATAALTAAPKLHVPASRAASSAARAAVTHKPSPTTKTAPASLHAPNGMASVKIDGQTYFYWHSSKNTNTYRDLFAWDPLHSGQLKSAGYGAPDANQTWRKLSLAGGGGGSSRVAGDNPYSSISPSRIAPDPWVSNVVRKEHDPVQGTSWNAEIQGRKMSVEYDFQKNAFGVLDGVETFGETFDQSELYVPGETGMTKLAGAARVITDVQREASLRAMGIDLELPLNFAAPRASSLQAIPKNIYSIWVGNKVIPDTILKNLESNALIAAGSGYSSHLYLSNSDPAVFASNRRNLGLLAPHIGPTTLEHSPFYREFEQSKYFEQYQAALGKPGNSNFASAADVIRYRLLFREGGLYIDTDDTLTALPGVLKTAGDGLALSSPLSHNTLKLDTQYNNSVFGTRAKNPTLEAVSEESYRRYLEKKSVYTNQRPVKPAPPAGRFDRTASDTYAQQLARFHQYMQDISYITGPDVFDHVIGDRLPAMRQIREAIKLRDHCQISPEMHAQINMWEQKLLPLNRIHRTGNAHSWTHNR